MIAATCELWIDGRRVPDGSTPGEPTTATVALSGLRVSWGRETTVDQPTPSQCTFDLIDYEGGTRFDAVVGLGSVVVVWAALDTDRRPVFAGRVSDLDASFDEGADAAVCRVVVTDAVADLASRYVGAEPWGSQYTYARVAWILAAVGDPVPAVVNTGLDSAWLILSRMDVDRQAAQGLLFEVAVSAGLVMWSSVDSAGHPFLRFEDPTTRPSQSRFLPDVDPGTGQPWTALVGPWSALSGSWESL